MPQRTVAWQMIQPSAKLELKELDLPDPRPGEALVQVEGCGLCHTDLGFLHGGVQTRKPLPLTLGHEIAGRVVAVGAGTQLHDGSVLKEGDAVIVPAVLPCGDCAFCRAERENICSAQKMPGNDQDGGFATHVLVPARYLVPVRTVPLGHELRHLAVVADAVTTPYQALQRARVASGDSVVVVGAGGVGIYGVQIAVALGARVIAVDVDPRRLEQAQSFGATAAVSVVGKDETQSRAAVLEEAKRAGLGRTGWKVFEMSGTAPGQRLAFSLLTPGGTLGVVGFTRDKVEIRLSNLMAQDADAFGSWGCPPRHYEAVLGLIAAGKIQVKPLVSFHPLSEINAVLERVHKGDLGTRAILVP